MKIIKPESMAVAYRNEYFHEQHTLSVSMLAMFGFGPASATSLFSEQELWQQLSRMHDSNANGVDPCWPKSSGEYILYGSAYSNTGLPVHVMNTEVKVGSMSKSLEIHGDRLSDPKNGKIYSSVPFISMPLTPAQAFGGEKYAQNPQGKGMVDIENGDKYISMPNVEYPSLDVNLARKNAFPAGYWGVSPSHFSRVKLLGEFGTHWLRTTWPYLPEDTSNDFFYEAPSDQRLLQGEYWSGDELFELTGFTPNGDTISSKLPGLRAKCFANICLPDGSKKFVSQTTRAETLWFFPEQRVGIILYRAHWPVVDEAGSDVLHLFAEWEKIESGPISDEEYYLKFRQGNYTSDESMDESDNNSGPLIAHESSGKASSLQEDEFKYDSTMSGLETQINNLSVLSRKIYANHGIETVNTEKYLTPLKHSKLTITEIEHLIDVLKIEKASLQHKYGLNIPELNDSPGSINSKTITPISLKELDLHFKKMGLNTHELLNKNNISNEDIRKLFLSSPELSKNKADTVLNYEDGLPGTNSSYDNTKEFKSQGEAAPDKTELHDKLTRGEVISRYQDGQSLAEFDLSGLDLSELILNGADFTGSLLEGASFLNSQLIAGRFHSSLIQGANFTGANLTNAELTQCSAAKSNFNNATICSGKMGGSDFTQSDFSGARLSETDLTGSIFERSCFERADAHSCYGEDVNFYNANLVDSNFTHANLSRVDFRKGNLDKANFTRASLCGADFSMTLARSAMFQHAILSGSRANSVSNFSGSNFSFATLDSISWSGALLTKACLVESRLTEADLTYCDLVEADLYLAFAPGCKMSNANLSQADLGVINLFQGSLRNADLTGASLQGANLYAVDFLGSEPSLAGLAGAKITRTILLHRSPWVDARSNEDKE